MPCIKCGRKLEGSQVFCSGCLENMASYPVKPGTPVYLPPQVPVQPVKNRRKKQELKPEEQIRQLKSAKRLLILVLVVLLVAFALLCTLLLFLLEQQSLPFPHPGTLP